MLINNNIDVLSNENSMDYNSVQDSLIYDTSTDPNFDFMDDDFIAQLSNELEIPMLLDATPSEPFGLRDDSPDQIMANVAVDKLPALNDDTPKKNNMLAKGTYKYQNEIKTYTNEYEEPLPDSAIFECIDELRNVDPMEWGPEAFPNLQSADVESNANLQHIKDSDSVSLTIEDLRALNPDYFNTPVKQELDIKFEPYSPNPLRNTPSPSDSNSSSDYYPSNYNMSEFLVSKTERPILPRKYSLDTPPISPPSALSPPTSPRGEHTLNIIKNNAPTVKLVQIAANGNLIPVQQLPRKVKIQPKPISKTLSPISKNINKKTIVLSAEHFAAFTQKVKLQSSDTELKKEVILLNNIQTQPKIMIKPEKHKNVNPSLQKNLFMTLPKTEVDAKPIIKPSGTGNVFIRPMPTNELEVKAIKKQQRMIKNRESACLSRKKKKEYVTALENQINDLSLENNTLKLENSMLKERLLSYGETFSTSANSTPKRSSFFSLPGNKNIRKNTAILLAMMFMVSFNIGSIGNFFHKTPEMTALDSAIQEPVHGRHLLWLGNEDTNPILQLPNSTTSKEDSSDYNLHNYTTMNEMQQPICPMFINVTESIRLDTELRKWIREPQFLNWSFTEKSKQSVDDFKVKLHTNLLPVYNKFDNKIDKTKPKYKLSKRKINLLRNVNKNLNLVESRNELDVFQPKAQNLKYMEFFEAINRRDDTFYVVSFSYDHLLLPALAHNKTLRPKMSLMLPTLDVNDSFSTDHITMMQIDCEVINTSLIQVKQNIIPNHLRRSQGNTTTSERTDNPAKRIPQEYNIPNYTEFNQNINNSLNPEYRPYFINKSVDSNNVIYKHLLTPQKRKP